MNSIHDFLQHQVVSSKTPFIQYAFFNRESTIFSYQNGFRDILADRMADTTTTCNLFSITKTFTALAVLQLAQGSQVDLKAPMLRYLPLFPYGEQVTIEQVQQDNAGIPNPLPLSWTHLVDEHSTFNRDDFFARVFKKNGRLSTAPGKKKVSGKTYEAFIQENIFEKAGIAGKDINFVIDPALHAKGYQKYWSLTNTILGVLIDKKKQMAAREGKWQPFRNFYVNGTPYGGLIGSGNGLIRYAQALLDKRFPLLEEAYHKILFTENKIAGAPTGMALSWFTGTLKGNQYYAHAGGGGGYYVELRIYPKLGIGSVVLNNRTGMRDERMLDKTDIYFDAFMF